MNASQASEPPRDVERNAKGRRALVIGGAGRLRGWCSRFLRARGHAVDIADPALLLALAERLASSSTSAHSSHRCARGSRPVRAPASA
jgi:hypothetical protein